MAQGGSRQGAGRKQGSTNKFSKELLARAKTEGDLPIDYLLAVMRDVSQDTRIRLEAAKVAAPYCHHKLAAVSLNVAHCEMSHEEWLSTLE